MITDNGKQFEARDFQELCLELNIDHQFTSVGHPQTNGLAEVTNRIILQGLKKRLDASKGRWIEELPNVLWSFRTTLNERTGESPFNLCFGTEAVIPVEIGASSSRMDFWDESSNNQKIAKNLNLLENVRAIAAKKEMHHKFLRAKYHDKRVHIRSFVQGELILRKNDVSRQEPLRKLDQVWEGPYIVKKAYDNRSYRLQDMDVIDLARI